MAVRRIDEPDDVFNFPVAAEVSCVLASNTVDLLAAKRVRAGACLGVDGAPLVDARRFEFELDIPGILLGKF